MTESLHVAFCGGGSGGHLTPAISIAEALLQRISGVRLSFFTSGRDVDRQIMAAWKTAPATASVTALPLTSSGHRPTFTWNLVRTTWQCRRHFVNTRPQAVVGLGGFASVPGAAAARSLQIPLLLLELNCIPGKANLWLSRWADTTFTGWPISSPHRDRWRSPLVDTGVPIRAGCCAPAPPRPALSQRTVLILGGSLGARSLNDIVLEAVVNQRCLPDRWHIVHQTGGHECARVATACAAAAVSATVTAFIADVPSAMREADLIVSRAGAVTLAEIAATGTPAILIPMPSAADDHQRHNAESYARSGAAEVVEQDAEGAADSLAAMIRQLCHSEKTRAAMEQSARTLRRPQAAAEVADHLVRYVQG